MEMEYTQQAILWSNDWASEEEVNKLDLSQIHLTFKYHINVQVHILRAGPDLPMWRPWALSDEGALEGQNMMHF